MNSLSASRINEDQSIQAKSTIHHNNDKTKPKEVENLSTLPHGKTIINDWKKIDKKQRHSMLDEIYEVPSIIVPAENIQHLLKPDSKLRPFLANDLFEGIHPRIKMVRDHKSQNEDNEGTETRTKKLVLLHPKCTEKTLDCAAETDNDDINTQLALAFPGFPSSLYESNLGPILHQCEPGPSVQVTVPYTHLPMSDLLEKLLPEEAHPPPVSFEIIGTVAHFNLKAVHVPYGSLIGEVILERFYPNIQTVVNKVGEVGGPYRTYDMDVLACSQAQSKNPFWVKVVEHSVQLEFDVSKVYWCTRLSGDRQRLLNEEFKPNQSIADAFCGVGALCIHAAKRLNCNIIANDLNPDAVQYAIDNAKRNGIKGRKQMDVICGDARDFIRNLGRRKEGLPDHLVMNFPLASPQFLDALRWWPRKGGTFRQAPGAQTQRRKGSSTIAHVYTFSKVST